MTDIWIAFRKHPRIFFLSETNIHVKMELFVTKMLRNISDIIQRPKLLDLSMEKRIIPRFEVAQIMFLMSENMSLITLFDTLDRVFVQAFDGVPQELVTGLLNVKVYFSKLEKAKMKFIAQMDKLRMANPAPEKELTAKKERSLFQVLEIEKKLKQAESNLNVAVYESGKAKMKINKMKIGHAVVYELGNAKMEMNKLK